MRNINKKFTKNDGGYINDDLATLFHGDVAEFSVWQTQTQISGWINGYSYSTEKFLTQEAGTIHINQLNQTILFRFKTIAERINSNWLKLFLSE